MVGFDGRKSSPTICKIVTSALNSIGIDCNMAGIVPTPCLEFAVKKLGYAGGMMITASHNPPQYNGIKPAGKDGVEISREDEMIIEKIYEEKDWIKNPDRWGKTGNEDNAIQIYLEGVVSQINSEKIKSREIKVVLDLGNGAQAVAAPGLCEMLNCKTFLVNSTIDGNFPGRGSEPTPENLSALSKTILQNSADVGIGFDGDGDRSIFCDNKGSVLTGDKSALVLARHILKDNPDSLVVTCLNSGNAIEELSSQFRSEVIRTKVGSVEVSRKMIPTKALIGFEENGGFMYGKHNQVRDGCMTLALMLEILSNSEKSLSEEISTLPPSFTTKDKLSCSPEQTKHLISVLSKEFPTSDTTDGIKIMFNPEKWVMIRPSGTEPIIRIYAEAKSKEELDGLMFEYLEKIKSIISR